MFGRVAVVALLVLGLVAAASAPAQAAPDLVLDMAGPDRVASGTHTNYTMTIRNAGTTDAAAGSGTIQLNGHVSQTDVQKSTSKGTCGGGPQICNVGTITAGEQFTITFRVLADTPGTGDLVFRAYPLAGDRNEADNVMTVSITVVDATPTRGIAVPRIPGVRLEEHEREGGVVAFTPFGYTVGPPKLVKRGKPLEEFAPTDDDVAIPTGVKAQDERELSSVIVPPGSRGCPRGRVLIWSPTLIQHGTVRGGTVIEPSVQMVMNDLDQPGSKAAVINLPSPPADVEFTTDDSSFVRMTNGEIVFVLGAVRHAPLPLTAGIGPLSAFATWSPYNAGRRGGFLIWRSKDCGSSWLRADAANAPIFSPDAATARISGQEPGRCGWPQYDTSKGAVKDPTAAGEPLGFADWFFRGTPKLGRGWWFGSFDRQELYADPWQPRRLYLSLTCGSGFNQWNVDKLLKPGDTSGTLYQDANGDGNIDKDSDLNDVVYPDFFPGRTYRTSGVFVSDDGGSTWSPLEIIVPDGLVAPAAMTSLPGTRSAKYRGGRLVVFHCGAGRPNLASFATNPTQPAIKNFGGARVGPNPPACDLSGPNRYAKFYGGGGYNMQSVAISRILRGPNGKPDAVAHKVRIAYPFNVDTPAGKSGRIFVATVSLNPVGSGANAYFPILRSTVLKGANAGDVIMPRFVESDRAELPAGSPEDLALLTYWWVKPSGVKIGQALPRGRFMDGENLPGDPVDLPGKSGFFGVNTWIGDYNYGNFTYDARRQRLIYLSVWPQTQKTSRALHYRSLFVSRPKATGPPKAQWGATIAGKRRTVGNVFRPSTRGG